MNYKFFDARRKGVLTKSDQAARVKFAQRVLKENSPHLWTRDICFYLDGVSFWYKTNPVAEAKTPRGKIWRKRKEGLHPDCTAKGAHTESGGKVLKMFMAISYGKGVIFCEEYEQYNGDYFANFIRRNFSKMFRASGKRHSKLFVQDNCPIQNCAKARKALKDIRAKLFAMPPRSCDLNPIENIFNLAKRDLKAQAIRKNLTYESFEQFSERVTCTLYGLSTVVIDNIICSMDKRLKLVIKSKGKRTKY